MRTDIYTCVTCVVLSSPTLMTYGHTNLNVIILYVLKTGTYHEYCEVKSFLFLKKTSETNKASYGVLKIECKTFTKHSYSGRPFTSYHYTVGNKKIQCYNRNPHLTINFPTLPSFTLNFPGKMNTNLPYVCTEAIVMNTL